MSRVQRFDRSPLKSSRVRMNGAGGLRIPASIARVGVQEYGDGVEKWGELRLAKEVMSPATLASVAGVPVTIKHEGGMIDPDSWRLHSHGHMGDRATTSDQWVHGDVVVSSAEAIRQVQRRELVEISVGYQCRLEPTSGTYQGQPYKYVQRDIRCNHVTLLPPGHARAGSDARLRLDSRRAQHSLGFSQLQGKSIMKVFRIDAKKATAEIDGRTYDLSKPDDRSALTKEINGAITSVGKLDQLEPAALLEKVQDLQGMAVSMSEALAGLMDELSAEATSEPGDVSVEQMEAAIGTEAMDALIAKRAEIQAKADGLKLETKGKTSSEIMLAILDSKNYKTEGMDAAQIDDLYGRIPTATFDSTTIDVVRSGPAGKEESNLDKVLAANKVARGSHWKSKAGATA